MSKKQKKSLVDEQKIQKELQEAEAEVNKDIVCANQTRTLKELFLLYFTILKQAPNSAAIIAVLEGLSKFSHLINVDFQQDLMKVLQELLADPDTPHVVALQCAHTTFSTLEAQGNALNLDLKNFYHLIYGRLVHIASLPSSEFMPILHHCFALMVTENNDISTERNIAFSKRLLSIICSIDDIATALAMLIACQRPVLRNRRLAFLLEPPSEIATASGEYKDMINDPDHCNAFAATLWELIVLQKHYHPTVRATAKQFAHGQFDDFSAMKTKDLYETYDSIINTGAFNPTLSQPTKHPLRAKLEKLQRKSGDTAPLVFNTKLQLAFPNSVASTVKTQTYSPDFTAHYNQSKQFLLQNRLELIKHKKLLLKSLT